MAETLFGLIGSLDADITATILIGLILFLMLFELVLEVCEEYAADAGYEDLLQKLYKEMMMMGFLSFGLFIAFNAFGVEHDEKYLAFEFAHITTFFIAIFFVVRAVGLVQYSKLAKRIFWNAHNETASALFEKYTNMKKNPFSWETLAFKYLGSLSPLRRNIEYTVLEDYFYKTYKLIDDEFRFVDYLSKSFKFYTIQLTDIQPLSWCFIIVLVLLNYMRVALVGDWHINSWCDDEDDDHGDDHRRRATEGDDVGYEVNHTCEEYLIAYALFCAAMLLLFSCTITFFTSLYKTRLLEKAGLKDRGDIAAKLYSMGNLTDQSRRSFEDLTVRVGRDEQSCCDRVRSCFGGHAASRTGSAQKPDRVKSEPDREVPGLESEMSFRSRAMRRHNLRRSSHTSGMFDSEASTMTLDRRQLENFYVCTLRVALETINELHEKEKKRTIQQAVHYISSCLCICMWPCGGTRNRGTSIPKADVSLQHRLSQFKRQSFILRKKSGDAKSSPMSGQSPVQMQQLSTDEIEDDGEGEDSSGKASIEDDVEEYYLQHPLVKEINDIFVFKSRHIYQFAIHMSLMLDSFYLAVWVTNLIYIANHTKHPVAYNLVLIVPVILMLMLISYNLIVSSIVLSITSLRNKGSEWICEQDNIKRRVLPVLRSEVLNLFPDIEQDGTIEKLYAAIDSDGDSGINKAEFSTFLHTMDIHPPENEIRALFRAMDTDGSGQIELEELRTLLLCPDKSFPSVPSEPHRVEPHKSAKSRRDHGQNSSCHLSGDSRGHLVSKRERPGAGGGAISSRQIVASIPEDSRGGEREQAL